MTTVTVNMIQPPAKPRENYTAQTGDEVHLQFNTGSANPATSPGSIETHGGAGVNMGLVGHIVDSAGVKVPNSDVGPSPTVKVDFNKGNKVTLAANAIYTFVVTVGTGATGPIGFEANYVKPMDRDH